MLEVLSNHWHDEKNYVRSTISGDLIVFEYCDGSSDCFDIGRDSPTIGAIGDRHNASKVSLLFRKVKQVNRKVAMFLNIKP